MKPTPNQSAAEKVVDATDAMRRDAMQTSEIVDCWHHFSETCTCSHCQTEAFRRWLEQFLREEPRDAK